MQVSIIIVNYQAKYFLEQTIASCVEALEGISGEIIVIDNNSLDDSISHAKKRFNEVVFIENNTNPGFGIANNQGFKIAKGKYLLALNPDTIIGRNTITTCIKFIETHHDCASIGVKMVDGNGRFHPESKRSYPTPWVGFCKAFGLTKLFPKSKTFAKYSLQYLDKNSTHKIEILSGAFMFMRADLVRKTGGFDPDFFMYGEDIDLSYKFIKLGYQNYYLPQTIIHYKGECTKKDSIRYVKIFYEAMIIFFKKQYPHSSFIWSAIIKSAVWFRASFSAVKQQIKKLLRCKAKISTNSASWVVVSENPSDIISVINTSPYSTNSIETKAKEIVESYIKTLQSPTNILLDNRDFSYQEILNFINKNHKKDVMFHIYSSENQIIISPKM